MAEGKRTKRGRPAGLLLNPVAVLHLLGPDNPQVGLAATARISAPVLSELMAGQRGASQAIADRIAAALGCPTGVIFPELVGYTATVRVFTASGADT
jgi:hypothetical protein